MTDTTTTDMTQGRGSGPGGLATTPSPAPRLTADATELPGLALAAWAVAELDASSGRTREARLRAADPACWAVLDAIGAALDGLTGAPLDGVTGAPLDGVTGAAHGDPLRAAPPSAEADRSAHAVPQGSRVGVIAVSEHATSETLHVFADEADAGRLSPRRFVAASPGTLVGISCSAYGFGGPSLLLTMPVPQGRPVAVELARQWLAGDRPQAEAVALVLHRRSPEGRHRGECLWLVPAPEGQPRETRRPAREEE